MPQLIQLGETVRVRLMQIARESSVYLGGTILPMIDDEGDTDFRQYIDKAKELEEIDLRHNVIITDQIQAQNKDLQDAQEKNAALMDDLKSALEKSENAKREAESNLDVLQKRTQFELMGKIVRVSLAIILGVGISTTLLYVFAIWKNKETALIGNTWSSMFGILLTNSFSIIGTIMGVKYASDSKTQQS